MRPFELIYIVLIGWGVLQHFYKPSRRKNPELLYKVVFSVFLIHFFLEQYRWQMLPAYFLGVSLIIIYQKKLSTVLKTIVFFFANLFNATPPIRPNNKNAKTNWKTFDWINNSSLDSPRTKGMVYGRP